jgi:hypothetical protein
VYKGHFWRDCKSACAESVTHWYMMLRTRPMAQDTRVLIGRAPPINRTGVIAGIHYDIAWSISKYRGRCNRFQRRRHTASLMRGFFCPESSWQPPHGCTAVTNNPAWYTMPRTKVCCNNQEQEPQRIAFYRFCTVRLRASKHCPRGRVLPAVVPTWHTCATLDTTACSRSRTVYLYSYSYITAAR